MALFRRGRAASPASSKTAHKEGATTSAKKLTKEQKQAAKADKPSTAAASATVGTATGLLVRRALGILALAFAVASAVSEWPIYLAYEKDWRRPAVGFTMNFSITAIVALLVGCSPPVRALKPRPGAERVPLSKQARNKIVAAVILVLSAFWYGFGPYGPSGCLTVAAMCAFVYLALP